MSFLADERPAERALVSLPSPLTAAERAVISHRRHESIVVTAGLHRQVWVSGTNLFTDVHIVNDSHKTVRKLELRLERIVLCYNHVSYSVHQWRAGVVLTRIEGRRSNIGDFG